mgnify:CR=1 FL=1
MSVFQSTNRLINTLGDNLQTLAWTIMRVLSSAMFMTHGWAKLFGERAQPMFGGMDFFGIDVGINMLVSDVKQWRTGRHVFCRLPGTVLLWCRKNQRRRPDTPLKPPARLATLGFFLPAGGHFAVVPDAAFLRNQLC